MAPSLEEFDLACMNDLTEVAASRLSSEQDKKKSTKNRSCRQLDERY